MHPLAPASLPEVIAAGATLGEDGPKWQFSQAAHVLLPGAWYDYTGRHTFVAGTSFAAPYMSMISGLFLTYPDACVFDGTRPPLLSFGYKNMHVSPAYIGLNCVPKPVNLLKNWSFEGAGPTQQIAKQWLTLSLSGEKRIKQKAFSGKAAFLFNSTPGILSMISQNADLTPGFETSEVLKLAAAVRAKNLQTDVGSIQVVIKYTDGTPKTKTKFFAPPGTYPYKRFVTDVTIASPNIKVMKVQIRVAEGGGKFWLDDVALVKQPPASIPLNNVLPLPAAPTTSSGQIARSTTP